MVVFVGLDKTIYLWDVEELVVFIFINNNVKGKNFDGKVEILNILLLFVRFVIFIGIYIGGGKGC